MDDAQDRLIEPKSIVFATSLDFVREYAIRIVAVEPGR